MSTPDAVVARTAGNRSAWYRQLRHAAHSPRFWLVQAAVLALSALHDVLLTQLHEQELALGIPAPLTTALLLIPVTYAALTFGLGGAVGTATWATALVIPHWLWLGDHPLTQAHLWIEVINFFVLMSVGIVVGHRVDREQYARRRAEDALRAASLAEARYRALFGDQPAPVIITSADGQVVELNAAAGELLGEHAVHRPLAASLGVTVDQLRAGNPPFVTCGTGTSQRHYLATTTTVSSSSPLVQIVLTDCTEQHRRQEEQRAFSSRLIAVIEEERRRLARELHDDPMQHLVYLARGLGDLAETPGLVPELVEELRRDAAGSRQAAASLRKLIHGLRPPILDDLGLVPALRQLAVQTGERAGLAVRVDITGSPVRLSPDIELTAYRVVQESLNNVLHHSRATTAEVAVQFGAELVVCIADDGGGFDTGPTRARKGSRGLGLVGMAERVAAVNGSLDVRSSPQQGTQVSARIPAAPAGGAI